jgi:hypothetical protein
VSSAAHDFRSDELRVALSSSDDPAKDVPNIHRTLSTHMLGFALYQRIRHPQVNSLEDTEVEQFRLGLDAAIRASCAKLAAGRRPLSQRCNASGTCLFCKFHLHKSLTVHCRFRYRSNWIQRTPLDTDASPKIGASSAR